MERNEGSLSRQKLNNLSSSFPSKDVFHLGGPWCILYFMVEHGNGTPAVCAVEKDKHYGVYGMRERLSCST